MMETQRSQSAEAFSHHLISVTQVSADLTCGVPSCHLGVLQEDDGVGQCDGHPHWRTGQGQGHAFIQLARGGAVKVGLLGGVREHLKTCVQQLTTWRRKRTERERS